MPPGFSLLSTSTMSMAGASCMRTTGKVLKLVCCTRPLSSVISCISAAPMPNTMLDWICASTVSGLTMRPRSAATVTRCTFTAPSSMLISATCAMYVS